MNDPHVEELNYKFVSDNPNDNFNETEPLEINVDNFLLVLKDGLLTVKPKEHYPDTDLVKTELEPLLKSWEESSFLSTSRFRIRFIFQNAKIIDRKPDPRNVNVQLNTAQMIMVAEEVTVVRGMTKYPEPILSFAASPLTDELIGLLKRYSDGRIPLAAMTNWFESILRREYGSREKTSKALNINIDILRTIGRLSESSDPEHGRKAKGQGPAKFSRNEFIWLETVVFVIVNRIGEINRGATGISQITMSDLPRL